MTHELPSQDRTVERPFFLHGKKLEQTKSFVNQWLALHPGERPNLGSMSEQLGLRSQSFRKRLQRIRKEDSTFLPREPRIKVEKSKPQTVDNDLMPKKEKPTKRTLGIEDATPSRVQRHKDIFATLTEAIREAGLRCKPAEVYSSLTEAGVRLKKFDQENHSPSRGKYTRFSSFFILRDDLPEIVTTLKSLEESKKIRRIAIRHQKQEGKIRAFVEGWNKSQPGSLSITKIAKSLHMGKETVAKRLKEIEVNEPEFPGPKKTHGLRVEDSTIENVTPNIAKRHPELYPSLNSIILDANVYLSPRQAANLIQNRGFKVRIIPEGSTARFFISAKDRLTVIILLRKHHLLLENISRYTARTHPELYLSLASIIRESRTRVNSQEIAEILPYFDIKTRAFPVGSSSRYFVYSKDKSKIIAFLQGLGKELLNKS